MIRAALDRVVEAYRVSLEIPDPSQIHAILGTVAANLGKDDKPIWLIFVGPPSSGKSDPMKYLGAIGNVRFTSEVTQGGLLSCSPTKGKANTGTGGLLNTIREPSVLVISDMSPILSLGEEGMKKFLGLMREVYDGKVIRHGGQDGGKEVSWTGKLGLLAASTGDIDRHHSIINTLGDRYLYFRMPAGDVSAKMERARTRKDNKKGIDAALKELFGLIVGSGPAELTDENEKTLQSLASFVAVARTAVIRDPHTRKLDDIAQPEEPTRLYLAFRTLLKGMIRIGLNEAEAMAVTSKIGLDSLPPARLAIIKMALAAGDVTVNDVKSGPWFFSTTAIHRAFEELVEYRLLTKTGVNGIEAHYFPSVSLTSMATSLPTGTFSDLLSFTWKNNKEVREGAPVKSEKVGQPDPDLVFGEIFPP